MHLHYHGPFLKLKMKTFLSIGLYFTISVVLILVRGVFAAHRSRKEYLFLGVLGERGFVTGQLQLLIGCIPETNIILRMAEGIRESLLNIILLQSVYPK